MEEHGSRIPRVADGSSRRSPAEEDARTQAVVIGLVLAEHPTLLTFAEVTRALLSEESEPKAEIDSVARAVAELVCYGLLHRNGDHLVPSRAALRLDELPLP